MNDWCFPIVQNVQRVFPGASVKDPQAQLVHVLFEEAPVSAEYFPMGQPKQMEDEVAPVDEEYVPAAQRAHVSVPAVLLYLPPAHAQQVEPVPVPSQSVCPASHE